MKKHNVKKTKIKLNIIDGFIITFAILMIIGIGTRIGINMYLDNKNAEKTPITQQEEEVVTQPQTQTEESPKTPLTPTGEPTHTIMVP